MRSLPTSLALLTACAALAACSSDRDLLRDVQSPDVYVDRVTPAPDVAADAAADTAVDVVVDLDVPADVRNDVPADQSTPMDAARDVAQDAVDVVTATDAAADVPADASTDAPRSDVPGDGGTAPDGRCTPTIDGTVAADWTASALSATNAIVTAWGADDQLRGIRVCYDATNLYLALEGSAGAMNGVVVYIDRDLAGGSGGTATGISLLSSLTDHTGALDSRIAAGLTVNVPGFGAEAAWGFAGFPAAPLAAGATSDTQGLRLFWPTGGSPDRRADFAWLSGAPTVCAGSGASAACETAIAWSSLFEGTRPASTTVALFARINNGDGSMSANQTLPQDDPSAPRTVAHVLRLDVR